MSLSCSKCNKVFGYHWNLKTHENKCSITVQNENNNLIKCPDSKCEYSFTSYALLRKHVENFHLVVLNKEQHCFKTLNEFMEWKQQIEKECVCSYVSKATARLKKGKRTYYYCHRSGYFKTKSQGKRRIKSQGSNKIDSTCTSSMVVTEDTNAISVNYCSTHFGHGSNLGRCRLIADERAMIAGETRKERITTTGQGTDETYKSKWIYFEPLKFLSTEGTVGRKTVCNLTESGLSNIAQLSKTYQEKNEDGYITLNDISNSNETINESINETIHEPTKQICLSNTSNKKKKCLSLDLLGKAYSVLSETEDDIDVFGKFVASEIRGLQTDHLRKKAKRQIQQILLDIAKEDDAKLSTTHHLISVPSSSFSSASSNSGYSTLSTYNNPDYNYIVSQAVKDIPNVPITFNYDIPEHKQ